MQKINLFVNYYNCGEIERQKEIDFCFNHNKNSGLFSNIINFNDRPTYTDFFNATLAYPEDINVFSNSDIYFNDTIKHVLNMGSMDAYALTRWEESENGIVPFETKHSYNQEAKSKHSQDVWVFYGAVNTVYGGFHIGVPGCDNRIAYEINKANYNLSNPSNIIKCVHKHANEKRVYTMPDKISPPYLWVDVNGTETPGRRTYR